MFDDHHGELAQMLLDQIAFCDTRIATLATRIEQHLARIPAAWGVDADGATGPGAGTGTDAAVLPAAQRLAEIPGVSAELARSIIAETGLDMSRFPTAAHLVSWAGLCPSARQSGPRTRNGKKGQGDSYLRGYLGQAATGAAGTATFLGERHERIARRRGRAKAQVAIARSILVIIWHLLADPEARFADLGPDYYASRTDKDKKIRNHIRQLQALGMDRHHHPSRLTHTARAQARPPHQPGSAAARPAEIVISGQDGGGPGRLALLRRRIRPGPEAAEGPHLGTARPHTRGEGDRRQ